MRDNPIPEPARLEGLLKPGRMKGVMTVNSILLIPLCSFLLWGCQTLPADDFERLKPGMDKNEVLEIMGNPQRSERWHGMDRWTYIFFDTSKRQEKEVHFSQGKAVYIGGRYVPPVTAAEQDTIFENENRELEKAWAERREQIRNQYQNYENEVRGTGDVRYVPQFEPIK